jgi:phage terminase large subunit-like protein
VGFSQSFYAKKVATGEVEDDQFFSAVYTLDETDDIFDPANWIKANPGYGDSVDPVTFEAKAKKAQEVQSDLANFKVKHLNIWLSEARAYYDTNKWDACADPTIKMEDFKGQKCIVGVDLASKIDLTSLGFIFKKEDKFYIFDKSYIPEATVKDVRSSLYEDCIGSGHLISTKGEAIHYPHIKEELLNIHKEYKIMEALYDPWNATSFAQDLSKERIEMVEFRFNTANLSEPTKHLDALIRQGRIVHNGSPLLRWCLGNVVCKEDAAGNVFPRKSHEKLKIDPIIALLMALASWMQKEKKESIYEEKGLRFL